MPLPTHGVAVFNTFLACVLFALVAVTIHLNRDPSWGMFVPKLGRYLLCNVLDLDSLNYLENLLIRDALPVQDFLIVPSNAQELYQALHNLAEHVSLMAVRQYHVMGLHLDHLQPVSGCVLPWEYDLETIYAAVVFLKPGTLSFCSDQVHFVEAGTILLFCQDDYSVLQHTSPLAIRMGFRLSPFRRDIRDIRHERTLYHSRWKYQGIGLNQRVRVR